jgi:hypothetical protein
MSFLLMNGADPNMRYNENEKKGMTVLHESFLQGKLGKARILLYYGADINLKCWRGRTIMEFLKSNYEGKSKRKIEELKGLLYKYTVK